MREVVVGNALSPTVDNQVGGTISADVDDYLSLCLELISATRRIQKLNMTVKPKWEMRCWHRC